MFCIQCGHQIPEDSEFCTECGANMQSVAEEQEGFCTECGVKLPADSAFCADCGAEIAIPEDERFCTECGQELAADSDFCPACGTKAEAIAIEESDEINAAQDISSENENVPEEADDPIAQLPQAPIEEIIEEDLAPLPVEVPLWEENALSDIEDNEPEIEIDAKEITKQRRLVTGLFGVTVALLAAVIVLVVFIVINRGGEDGTGWRGTGQHEYDPTANMTREEYHIHRIYTGNLPAHPNVQIGLALEGFFTGHPVWSHFVDEHFDYVSVHAEALVDGEITMVQIIFQFSADSEVFAPVNLMYGGSFQDIELLNELLNNVMLGIR